MLEEYGAPSTQANQTAIEQQWQATVLASDIAYDSFWQFGSHDLPNGENENDTYTLYHGTSQYQMLAVEHAAAMEAKPVL